MNQEPNPDGIDWYMQTGLALPIVKKKMIIINKWFDQGYVKLLKCGAHSKCTELTKTFNMQSTIQPGQDKEFGRVRFFSIF